MTPLQLTPEHNESQHVMRRARPCDVAAARAWIRNGNVGVLTFNEACGWLGWDAEHLRRASFLLYAALNDGIGVEVPASAAGTSHDVAELARDLEHLLSPAEKEIFSESCPGTWAAALQTVLGGCLRPQHVARLVVFRVRRHCQGAHSNVPSVWKAA